MSRILPIIISLLFFQGCSWFRTVTPEPEIIREIVYINREAPDLPLPKPLELDDVQWYVVTPDNISSVWQELVDSKRSPVLFAVTPNGYQVFSGNTEKIMNYIKLLQDNNKQINEYYQQPIKEPEK